MLQEFKDIFPEDGPSGMSPEETKELQCQVEELISPCSIHVLLVPKRMVHGGYVFIFVT